METARSGPLAGTSVSVVGMSYAPEPTGIGPYTAGLAEMLVEHGAQVDAITGVPHYPSWRVEPQDRWRLRRQELRNGVQVHRARHFVPRRQSALTRLVWEGTFLANASLVRPSHRPDLVIAASPSLSGALVGSRLARSCDVPFAVVVQDLVGQAALQSGIRGGQSVSAAAGRAESWVLRSAAMVVVVTDSFRRQLADYGVRAERIRLLPNWTHIPPPQRDRQQVRRELGWHDDAFVVLHTGNMGLKQDLGNVVQAARQLGDRPDVRLVLMGDGNQREVLEGAAADCPALQFLPPVAGELYPDVLRAADLLLVNERPTVGEMSLPSKLTSYFAVGQPVLAAVSADGACARELAATGGGGMRVDPGQPAALVDGIRVMQSCPDRRTAMGRAGRAHAETVLGRRTAADNLLGLATELLSMAHR